MADIERINTLVAEKDFEQAVTLVEDGLKESPDDLELIKLSGLIYVNLQEWLKARTAFETVIKYKPEDASSWFYAANCYDKLGDFISAKNAYLKVIALRRDYIEAYKSLCITFLKLNEPEEAVKYAGIANSLAGDDYIFDFVIGTAYMKIKEFAKSIEPFERALAKSPNNIGIYNSLGTAYMATNRSDDAVKCYQKALELAPDNPMSYYNLGSAYQIQQNHEQACQYFKQAIKLDNEDEGFKVAYAM